MRLSGVIPSLVLAGLLTAGAGLPGMNPLAQPPEPLRLMAMTELEADDNGHFFTNVDINNRSVEVIVDTGASTVALSYEDADRVGLKPRNLNYDVVVQTANGVVKAARVTLREVEVGNIRVANVDGMVLPKGALNGTLLGMSFLSRIRNFSIEKGVLVLKN